MNKPTTTQSRLHKLLLGRFGLNWILWLALAFLILSTIKDNIFERNKIQTIARIEAHEYREAERYDAPGWEVSYSFYHRGDRFENYTLLPKQGKFYVPIGSFHPVEYDTTDLERGKFATSLKKIRPLNPKDLVSQGVTIPYLIKETRKNALNGEEDCWIEYDYQGRLFQQKLKGAEYLKLRENPAQIGTRGKFKICPFYPELNEFSLNSYPSFKVHFRKELPDWYR